MQPALMILAVLLTLLPASAQKVEFVVVVGKGCAWHPANEAEAKAAIKKLFLQQATAFPSGGEAKMIDRAVDSAVRKAFVEKVLGMTDADLARHWLKIKNQNGLTPPKEVTSDRMVARYLEKYEETLTFMTAEAAKELGARVVLTF